MEWRTALIAGYPRETQYLLQSISVAEHVGNGVSVRGTIPPKEGDDPVDES